MSQTPRYRFGDQRPDGLYFYARRQGLLTGIWLTEEAFRKRNGGKLPALRKGRIRADGRIYHSGAWVSPEVFAKLSEGDRVKRIRPGERKFVGDGTRVAFAGYTQGGRENWMPEDKWVRLLAERKRKRALKKATRRAILHPRVCGQTVRAGLIYVGEFTSAAKGKPTRVYFNCSQWKAAMEGQNPPPPELRRARLRAYWWLVRRLRARKNAESH